MQQLVLPACVEVCEDRGVVVRGHRVSLFLILDAHYSGQTATEMHERFPTISIDTLQEIVAFCWDNEPSMRQFHAEQLAERNRAAATFQSLDLEELRRRRT